MEGYNAGYSYPTGAPQMGMTPTMSGSSPSMAMYAANNGFMPGQPFVNYGGYYPMSPAMHPGMTMMGSMMSATPTAAAPAAASVKPEPSSATPDSDEALAADIKVARTTFDRDVLTNPVELAIPVEILVLVMPPRRGLAAQIRTSALQYFEAKFRGAVQSPETVAQLQKLFVVLTTKMHAVFGSTDAYNKALLQVKIDRARAGGATVPTATQQAVWVASGIHTGFTPTHTGFTPSSGVGSGAPEASRGYLRSMSTDSSTAFDDDMALKPTPKGGFVTGSAVPTDDVETEAML